MISIPKSRYTGFIHFNKAKRWGQAFYDYMRFDRVKDDRAFLDKLYNEPDNQKAKDMVLSRLDHTN